MVGFCSISYYGDKEYKYFWSNGYNYDGEYTVSSDGKYYAEGLYNLNKEDDRKQYSANKKKVPWEIPYKQTEVFSNSHKYNQREMQPYQEWVDCPLCMGGKCPTCDGQGWKWVSNGNPNTQCIRCGESGRCNACSGQGDHYEIQYR